MIVRGRRRKRMRRYEEKEKERTYASNGLVDGAIGGLVEPDAPVQALSLAWDLLPLHLLLIEVGSLEDNMGVLGGGMR